MESMNLLKTTDMPAQAVAPKAVCWRCESTDVALKFVGYRSAFCVKGCLEEHLHYEDVPQVECLCRACGLAWQDGSGEFAEMMVC